MQKSELINILKTGVSLDSIFFFSNGQNCLIYKGKFQVSDDIIYIPDIDLNNISIDRKLSDEEIENVIDHCYSGNEFIMKCNGHIDIAEQLFFFVDWQHPNIQDFLEGYSEEEFLEDWGFSIDELQNCCANSNGMV